VVIDLTREVAVALADVPKLPWIPTRRGGRRLHVATVHRWCTVGVQGVRLAYVQLGGTRVTTIEALVRFFDELTRADCANATPAGTKPVQRNAKIEEELDAAGFR
jgi:hypothetical protein